MKRLTRKVGELMTLASAKQDAKIYLELLTGADWSPGSTTHAWDERRAASGQLPDRVEQVRPRRLPQHPNRIPRHSDRDRSVPGLTTGYRSALRAEFDFSRVSGVRAVLLPVGHLPCGGAAG